jgi:protein-histidine N-methyltransferase
LPPLLSYTPVSVPIHSQGNRQITLLRRDLFDARFQILNQDECDDQHVDKEVKGKAKEVFVDEQSDLVKGVYEGGLKTWECSLDLVDCLDQQGYPVDRDLATKRIRGSSVLEVRFRTLDDLRSRSPTNVAAHRSVAERLSRLAPYLLAC